MIKRADLAEIELFLSVCSLHVARHTASDHRLIYITFAVDLLATLNSHGAYRKGGGGITEPFSRSPPVMETRGRLFLAGRWPSPYWIGISTWQPGMLTSSMKHACSRQWTRWPNHNFPQAPPRGPPCYCALTDDEPKQRQTSIPDTVIAISDYLCKAVAYIIKGQLGKII